MKSKKKLLVFLIVSIVLMGLLATLFGGWSSIEDTVEVPEEDTAFYIKDYDVNMVVTAENKIEVEEIITTEFSLERHGIYRNIPLIHTMNIEENGKTKQVTQSIKYSEVKGNQYAAYYESEGNLVIRLGHEKLYQPCNEDVVFAISYILDLGRDYAETFDMLYYNIVGSGWKVPILNFDYSITMPKEFDASNIKMYRGLYGERNEIDSYSVDGTVISGNAQEFAVGEAMTIDLRLPENYFDQAKIITYPIAKACIYVSAGILVAIILLFVFRTPRETMVSPVEFYPPDNMNPVQISTILHGKAQVNDIVSLIIYFASKKYITIKKGEKRKIILTKIKHINPKEKNYVKKLFERLFVAGDTIDLSADMNDSVDVDYIDKKGRKKKRYYDPLSTEIYECADLANENKPVKKRFDIRNMVFSIVGASACGIGMMIYLIGYSSSLHVLEFWQMVCTILTMVGIYFLTLELGIHRMTCTRARIITHIILLVCYLVNYIMITIFSFENIAYTQGYTHYVVSAILLLGVVAAANLLTYSQKQTKMLGRVLGFRNFLLTCEKDRMAVLLKDNPEYFYDILPYAYVFDITDEFMDRFEILGFKPPASDYFWDGDYDRIFFRQYSAKCNSISRQASMAQTASRMGSGSGGGGGGFSGGGFGGGGGGSW